MDIGGRLRIHHCNLIDGRCPTDLFNESPFPTHPARLIICTWYTRHRWDKVKQCKWLFPYLKTGNEHIAPRWDLNEMQMQAPRQTVKNRRVLTKPWHAALPKTQRTSEDKYDIMENSFWENHRFSRCRYWYQLAKREKEFQLIPDSDLKIELLVS